VKKLCAGAVPKNPAKLKMTQNQVLSRIKTHTPSRSHAPGRGLPNPKLTH
jgi:hypothetical protein